MACLVALMGLLAVNVVAAWWVWADKRRARRGRRRVPERTLHAWALLGGGLAGWAVLLMVRHKTRKGAFLVPYAVAGLAGLWLPALVVWAC